MNNLPFVIDWKEAFSHFHKDIDLNDAQKSYLIGFLAKKGKSNAEIRSLLGIRKVYTVTHYKRAGTLLSEEELQLWNRNPTRITLGHVRAVTSLPRAKREALLRGLLTSKKSVQELVLIAKGKENGLGVDIKRFATEMGESIGRNVEISYDRIKRRGSLTLDFYSLDDLDDLSSKLGYTAQKEF